MESNLSDVSANLPRLCIIVPAFNEETVIAGFIERLELALTDVGLRFGICVVDDGSKDATWEVLQHLKSSMGDRLHALRLSRNYGKDAAIFAGLEACVSDIYLIIDGDGQHPPELIARFISKWREGCDIVDGIKRKRHSDSMVQVITSNVFHFWFSLISGLQMNSSSDFKLLNRKAVEAILRCGDYNLFFRGLTNWVGLRHGTVEFDIDGRSSGKRKWTSARLLLYALDALVMYSNVPLYLVLIIGLISLTLGLFLSCKLIWIYLMGGMKDYAGYSTLLLLSILAFGGIMISLGSIGLYVKNILDQVKNRPRYIIWDQL